jgi:peptidoglycan/LPS O-acetylase OafA/YrhL
MIGHFSENGSTPILSNARLAPDLFFSMSGFVLAHSYQRSLQDGAFLSRFVLRRLIRLYPLFVLGLAMGAVAMVMKLAAGQTDLSPMQVGLATLLNALYLPYLGGGGVQFGAMHFPPAIFPINDPSWSLFFEWVVNLIFAVWVWRGAKGGRAIVAASAVLLVAFVYHTRQPEPGWGEDNILGGLPRTMFGFFAGVVAYGALDQLRRHLPRLPPLLLLAAALAVFAVPDLRHEEIWWLGGALIVMPGLMVLGAVAEPRSQRMIAMLQYLGWLSYPIYCLHFPIYSAVTTLRGSAESPLWLIVTLSLVVWALAHVCARWIDEPVRAALTRRSANPPALPAMGMP